ncbi:hypothetical protein CY34DRAFT_700060 [Suillus luteus UH-Slu-Lm8-n1]|uniref:Uncharacterized protein n=1 Tax=Suillus luteus UH-Slu-Lm8-n1 TaxID=930992 RepID=A0A0D0AP49_9AGAM|nr:hypothetical protein CY34DRAFT_700060 [Suillus luteus UH-Slu-Lm8-n1]
MSSCDISLVAVWPDQRQFTIMDRMAYDELPNRTVMWLRFVGTWILGSVFSPSCFRLFDTLHADTPCAEVESNGSAVIIPCISGEDHFFYLHVEAWVPYPKFADGAGDERDAPVTDSESDSSSDEAEEADVLHTPSLPSFRWLPGGLLEGDDLDELENSCEVTTIIKSREPIAEIFCDVKL